MTKPFHNFGLIHPVIKALEEVGYETPTPIQTETIPHLMAGRDLLGQAQTGTGKTAAFALPLLSRLNLKLTKPQVLVLVPTRELAIQVAEAFQRYAAHMTGFHVLPIYGGAPFSTQLHQLKRGVHVVVGTPGRVMDHMRRRTLKLDGITSLILDEADEMLRMGFIDDVGWILEQTPASRQTCLFSATLPIPIRKVAAKHLRNPVEVTIKVRTTTAETIQQYYCIVSGFEKLDTLTRILEAENFDASLVFVRTKVETLKLAEKLQARGYAASALNGDLPQKSREQIVASLKKGALDVIVATDVAARGLDVTRISHVINYDVPNDPEAYVHRIGRTGRAGKKGEAIIFVAPRERHLLRIIEKATRQEITMMKLPTRESIHDKKIGAFKERITEALGHSNLPFLYKILEQYQRESNIPPLTIAAALATFTTGAPIPFVKEKTFEEKPRSFLPFKDHTKRRRRR